MEYMYVPEHGMLKGVHLFFRHLWFKSTLKPGLIPLQLELWLQFINKNVLISPINTSQELHSQCNIQSITVKRLDWQDYYIQILK